MSKRMTDTGKWLKPWFRKLEPKYKLFWIYILDHCDLAGFWDIDFDSASYFIGEEINPEEATSLFQEQIYPINGKYWMIIDFIQFQNGWPLNIKSPVHKKIIELLNVKGIDIKDNTLYDRVHNRVCNTLIVKVIVEDKVKVGEKVKVDNTSFVKIENSGVVYTDLDDLKMELLNSHSWIEAVAINSKLSIEQVRIRILDFIKHLKAGNETGRSLGNYQSHFRNWVNKKQEVTNQEFVGMTAKDYL